MKPGDSSTKREQHRAELLHRKFSRVHGLPLTNEGKFLQARKLGAWRDLRSLKTFTRLYPRWKKSPCPDTLLRRWTNGPDAQNDLTAFAVCALAVEKKVSVHAVCKRLRMLDSYSTILRRNKGARVVGKLAKIERARKRLAKARAKELQTFRGIEP